jgi:hypothetical protein
VTAESLQTWVTALILGLAFLLALLNQFEKTKLGGILQRANRFGLWPNWTLFVRPPSDLRLWVQQRWPEEDGSGLAGEATWRHYPYGSQRRLRQLVWHPELRSAFWLFFAVREQAERAVLARRSAWGVVSDMHRSIGYKTLKHFVAQLPGASEERRFAIVYGEQPPPEAGRLLIFQSPKFAAVSEVTLPEESSPRAGDGEGVSR